MNGSATHVATRSTPALHPAQQACGCYLGERIQFIRASNLGKCNHPPLPDPSGTLEDRILRVLWDRAEHHPSEFPGEYGKVIRVLRSLVERGVVVRSVKSKRKYYQLSREWRYHPKLGAFKRTTIPREEVPA